MSACRCVEMYSRVCQSLVSLYTQKHTYNEHLQVKVRIFHKVSLRSEYKRLRYNDTGEDRVINSGPLQG